MFSRYLCRILLLAAFVSPSVAAGDPSVPGQYNADADWGTNVLITFTVGKSDQGKDVVLKTYEMMVSADGETIEMSTGARVPIPTTSFENAGMTAGNTVPTTSFTYQQIGFTAKVRTKISKVGEIRLHGMVEDSSLGGQPTPGGRPFIQSLQQRISAKLQPGEPMRLFSVDEVDQRTMYIDVKAELLGAV